MPSREVWPTDERMQFIAAVLAGDVSMTELCEEFGVSRKTGYQFLGRYYAPGPTGLADRAAAGAVGDHPSAARAIVGLRREHPSWGPKKLRAKLRQRGWRGSREQFTALSTGSWNPVERRTWILYLFDCRVTYSIAG